MQETFDTPASRFLTYAGVWFAVLAWGTSFVAARFLLHPEKPGQATLSPLVLAAEHLPGIWFFVGSLLPDRQRFCLCSLLYAKQALDAAYLAPGDDGWNNDEWSGWPRTSVIA